MVEWLAGNRIRGTSTERTTTCGFNPVSAVSGGWKEIGRTTLGGSGDTISVSSLDDKRYYMILGDVSATGGNTVSHVHANSDTGSNYVVRTNVNKGSDSQSTNTNRFFTTHNDKSSDSRFMVSYIANKSDKEKLGIYYVNENPSTGAGTAATRIDGIGKHVQTSCALNALQLFNDEPGSFDTGGELVVLGYDPADTHTTNFWEELASVDITSGSQMTANFTAKKYLWIQFYYEASTTSSELFFNNDQGNNYARRYSSDGGTSTTNTSIAGIQTNIGWDTNPHYGNMFVINNSANEKLVIGDMVAQLTAGAGNAPTRLEFVSKWANTSEQINRFDITNTGSFSRGICKVWGSN